MPSSNFAVVSSVPTSEPPARSVIHCVPFHRSFIFGAMNLGIRYSFSSGLPKVLMMWIVASVIDSGHIMPNSDWMKRYWKAYFAICGAGAP